MEEKMLRGIQRCPVTAVHHTSWPRCSVLLNQMACCYPRAFLLLQEPPPYLLATSNIVANYSFCPGPLLQLQMQSCSHCGSLVHHQAPSYRLHPTQERCTCGRWALLMVYRIFYHSLLKDMENLVWLAVVFCIEFSDCFLACYLNTLPKRWTFQKNSCCICTNQCMFTISASK